MASIEQAVAALNAAAAGVLGFEPVPEPELERSWLPVAEALVAKSRLCAVQQLL